MRGQRRKGFTLAELLIVVVIIAVLVGIGIPIFGKLVEKSRDAASIANIRSAYSQAQIIEIDALTDGLADPEQGKRYFYYDSNRRDNRDTIENRIHDKIYAVYHTDRGDYSTGNGEIDYIVVRDISIKSKKANNWSGLADQLPFPVAMCRKPGKNTDPNSKGRGNRRRRGGGGRRGGSGRKPADSAKVVKVKTKEEMASVFTDPNKPGYEAPKGDWVPMRNENLPNKSTGNSTIFFYFRTSDDKEHDWVNIGECYGAAIDYQNDDRNFER